MSFMRGSAGGKLPNALANRRGLHRTYSHATLASPIRRGQLLLGKYRVEGTLGRGGMGTVFAARHLDLDRLFAIKVLRKRLRGSETMLSRFVREARTTVHLRSPHVVKVHDVGTLHDGAPYMLMEHLRGNDLASFVRRHGPLPLPYAVHLVLQACEALDEAHARGIVHRDLKLANLFLTHLRDGSPCLKVLDFGLSKDAYAPSDLTSSDMLVGSPHYMSPEQLSNNKLVDHRSDIWALGVILYELTTGTRPFCGATLPAIMHAILNVEPPPPSSLQGTLPAAFDALVTHCLVKQVSARCAHVEDLAGALAKLLPGRIDWPASYVEPSPPLRAKKLDAHEHIDAKPLHKASTAHAPSFVQYPARSDAGDDDTTAPCRKAAAPGAHNRDAVPTDRLALELPGGVVPADSPFYVTLDAIERRCFQELRKPGALVRIKGPRGVGKTSLMTKLIERAAAGHIRAVIIDLQLVDDKLTSSLERFLQWFCATICRDLGLTYDKSTSMLMVISSWPSTMSIGCSKRSR